MKYLVIILLGFSLQKSFGQNSQNDFDAGILSFNLGDLESAYFLMDSWIRENPKDPLAYWYFGQILEQMDGQSEQMALESYTNAISLNSQIAAIYFSRGRLLLKLDRFEEAEKDFWTYRGLPKGETSQVIYRKTATDKGFSGIFTAQTENPSQILYHIALAKIGKNEFHEAQIYLDSALIFSPNEADFYAEKGKTFMESGEVDKALSSLKAALEIEPNHYLAKQRILILENGGDVEKLEAFAMAINSDPENPQPWKLRGFYHFSQDNWTEALEDFSKAISLAPEDEESWYFRGKTYSKLQKWEFAEKDYDEAIYLETQNPEIFLARGQARYNLNELEGALADFIQLIAIDPTNPNAFYHRGITLHRLGDISGACEDLKRAVNLGMEEIAAVQNRICKDI